MVISGESQRQPMLSGLRRISGLASIWVFAKVFRFDAVSIDGHLFRRVMLILLAGEDGPSVSRVEF